MAIMLEFWRQKALNRVMVCYDDQIYSLGKFLQLPEAKSIIEVMYNTIRREHPYHDTGDITETVGKFIKENFMDLDKTFDVVILGDPKNPKVIFNTEKNPPL